MKTRFKRNIGRKIRNLNINKHKATRILDPICQTNKKLFVAVNKKKTHVNWN